MARLYADLHAHPTLYAFNRLRNDPRQEGDPERFHPWRDLPVDARARERGAHAATYRQCSFDQCVRSRTRLVFASLTPIEKGFFEVLDEGRRPFGIEALRLATGATLARGGLELARHGRDEAVQEITAILRNRGPLRMLLQMLYLRYGLARVRYITSDAYDYWDEFFRELDFLRSRDGQRVPPGDHGGGGCYRIVRGAGQLRRILDGPGDDVACVLTIEGAYVFAVGPGHAPLDLDAVMERISVLKAQPEPVLFVTFAHHFDNGLCGHAHSIPDAGRLVIDQRRAMGDGFVRDGDRGMRVARELLDLDDDLEDRGGRRILLDVKHMSPRARGEYYAEIVRPYNERWAARSRAQRRRRPRIPVIASHVAYSGATTLRQLVDGAGREDDHWFTGGRNAWGINLCDEDIAAIHDSEGILGVILDRRVAGVAPGLRPPEEMWSRVVVDQVLGIVDAVMLDDRRGKADRRRIWDRIALGSDYDGVMHPIPRYPTVERFDLLAEDLARHLHAVRHTRMIGELGVDDLVEKICWRNAADFALRHLPAACG